MSEGSKFIFGGVVYLNLGLQTEKGHTYTLEYEPVFVSSQISTNINGMKTEERFKLCFERSRKFNISLQSESWR